MLHAADLAEVAAGIFTNLLPALSDQGRGGGDAVFGRGFANDQQAIALDVFRDELCPADVRGSVGAVERCRVAERLVTRYVAQPALEGLSP